ncbi:MAG: ABC transporter ATP-binding protein [Ilumatobacteraceae bacterium]
MTEPTRAMGAPSAPLLAVHDLTVDLHGRRGVTRIVDHVSFEVHHGEFLGLAGESGSGKSMTALALLGLQPSERLRVSGQVLLDGRDLRSLSRRELHRVRGNDISIVFQDPVSSLHPALRIGEQIAEGIRYHQGVSRGEAHRRAVELMDQVGIPDAERRARARPHEFSGGMLQRVGIAIALSCSPKLLIADEPTTALDVTVQAQVLDLLRSLQAETGMAIMMISHDLGVLSEVARRILVMYAGEVVEDGPTERFLRQPLHPYAAALLHCAPHPVTKGEPLEAIPGAPPAPGAWPTGCRFAPRCPHVEEACEAAPIELRPFTAEVGAPVDDETRTVRCRRSEELVLGEMIEGVLS